MGGLALQQPGHRCRGGIGLAALVGALAALIVPASPSWAKAGMTLAVREKNVGAGQEIHFSGVVTDDGGTEGRGACLYQVVGGKRWVPLHRCTALRIGDDITVGTFALTVKAPAAGTFVVVAARREEDGTVVLQGNGEPAWSSAEVPVTVTASAQPSGPAKTPQPSPTRPAGSEPTASSAPGPGMPARSIDAVADTRESRTAFPMWAWWAAGLVVAALLGGAVIARRRSR